MCAITLALIGHSGLDEDKCLGLGWGSIAPTGFHSISERKEMFINGTVDVTGLESLIISQTFRPLDHTICHLSKVLHAKNNRQTKNKKSDFKAAVCAFERTAEDAKSHESLEPQSPIRRG